MISIEDFSKVEMKIATILSASRVEGSEKLVRLEVNAGERGETGEPKTRQILAGIAKAYEPETLVGRQIVIVANLEPRKLMGLESQGMLLAASGDMPVLLAPEREVPPGSGIR